VRVAVTGAHGRLGSALVEALGASPFTGATGPIAWSRPELDLDTLDVASATALIDRDRPEVVIHAAAWTDVDGCARDPQLARRRNATATGELAAACAGREVDLILISTNEVFDGRRADGTGYAPDDAQNPINAYGSSKAEAERLARDAIERHAGTTSRLAVVRTAWLHGPPGGDFPAKIAAAAIRARDAGEPLRVVGDEIGSPTYAPDVAEALCELLAEDAYCRAGPGRVTVHHLVNEGRVSRADWAREVLSATAIEVAVIDIPAADWPRASTPPRWAVLEPTGLPSGERLRSWQAAFADAVPALRRALREG